MHITASVFINDDEAGLHHDYDLWLEKLAPHAPVSQYRHNVGRGQRRRPSETADHGPGGGGGCHGREARFRPLGADLLRRVRRRPPQKGAGEDYRGRRLPHSQIYPISNRSRLPGKRIVFRGSYEAQLFINMLSRQHEAPGVKVDGGNFQARRCPLPRRGVLAIPALAALPAAMPCARRRPRQSRSAISSR